MKRSIYKRLINKMQDKATYVRCINRLRDKDGCYCVMGLLADICVEDGIGEWKPGEGCHPSLKGILCYSPTSQDAKPRSLTLASSLDGRSLQHLGIGDRVQRRLTEMNDEEWNPLETSFAPFVSEVSDLLRSLLTDD